MITKKQLLERIKSLEDFLGIVYAKPEDLRNSYGEHYAMAWGEIPNMRKQLEDLTKKSLAEKDIVRNKYKGAK